MKKLHALAASVAMLAFVAHVPQTVAADGVGSGGGFFDLAFAAAAADEAKDDCEWVKVTCGGGTIEGIIWGAGCKIELRWCAADKMEMVRATTYRPCMATDCGPDDAPWVPGRPGRPGTPPKPIYVLANNDFPYGDLVPNAFALPAQGGYAGFGDFGGFGDYAAFGGFAGSLPVGLY